MPSQTRPLVLAAASAATVASLVAVVHFTGLIHKNFASPPTQTFTQAEPTTSPTPETRAESATSSRHDSQASKPRELPRPPHPAAVRLPAPVPAPSAQRSPTDFTMAPPTPTARPQPICQDCGTVADLREIAMTSPNPGFGAVAGGVLGGVVGHQMGRGTGRDVATLLGAIGGAVAGHQIERNVTRERQFEIVVRFDDGSQRSFTLPHPQWRPGDRVRLTANGLTPL